MNHPNLRFEKHDVDVICVCMWVRQYDLTKTQPSNTDDLYDVNRTEAVTLKHLWHPLHLVASSGRYNILKYFIDDRKCNPYLEDYDGNSALHHAMKVTEFELKTHLMDYVDAEHVSLARDRASRMGPKQVTDEKSIAERQGCINRLLQVGCEVFKANKRKQVPYPTGSMNDARFLSWWYGKQEKEFNTTQNNLNFATNAIAVTATLVATASYMGPLQPPMGYDASQIQYQNVWVSMFIVCDTLSFYFAIVAITLSLIPALPMPQQAMMDELQRTRGMVILAVGILLPSIFFVFVAFACSSISVMSANITSEIGGILTIVSTLVGIFLCFLAFTLFTVRLLAFVYPRKESIRIVYEFSNYVTKFAGH